MITVYDAGDLARLECTITDEETDETVDPSAIKFVMRTPDDEAALIEYEYGVDDELKRKSEGIFYVDFLCEDPGYYNYRFEATGDVTTAQEDCFKVAKSKVL
jgi:hypothetical protein